MRITPSEPTAIGRSWMLPIAFFGLGVAAQNTQVKAFFLAHCSSAKGEVEREIGALSPLNGGIILRLFERKS